MTNPYHDETGRFCSKGEMKAIVDQLGAAVAAQAAKNDPQLVDRWIEMKSAYAAAEAKDVDEARDDFTAPEPKAAPARLKPEVLSDLMEFGRIVNIAEGGVYGFVPDDEPYVEEIQYVYSEEDGSTDEPEAPAGWEYLKGFTGQYNYNGPVMHSSEYMGGRLAEHIIDNPGTYVTVAIEALPADLDSNEESEPVGWGVLRRIEAPVAVKPEVAAAEKARRRESVKDLMDFGRVIQVGKEGVPFPALNGLGRSTAPEEIQYVDLDENGGAPDPVAPKGWEYLKGFTGQHGYNGSVMHESEFIGGSLADHILENPGFYASVEICTMPEGEWVTTDNYGNLDGPWASEEEAIQEGAGKFVHQTEPEPETVGWGILRYVGSAD